MSVQVALQHIEPYSAMVFFSLSDYTGSGAFSSDLFHLALTQLHLFTATHSSLPLKCPPVLLWDGSRGAGWKPFEKRPLPAEVLLAWKRRSLSMEASLTRLVRGFPLSHGPRGPCQTSLQVHQAWVYIDFLLLFGNVYRCLPQVLNLLILIRLCDCRDDV